VSDARKAIVERVLRALVVDEGRTTRDVVRDDIAWFGGPGWKGFEPGSSRLEIQHLVAEDDLVSAHYRRTARRFDGSPYDAEYNILFRFDGDRIADVWEVADTAATFAPSQPRR
jgi:hypothetical protein